MGYTTYFNGELSITPALSPEQVAYLQKFSTTRRMKRDATKAEKLKDDLRMAVGLPIGVEGGYFVGAGGFAGQGIDGSVIEYNSPPSGQPGLWCQWTVSDDGEQLMWDEGEKFYCYDAWLVYLVEHFFKPWGCELEGEIIWDGENSDDKGVIYAKGFQVEAISDVITNPGPSWAKA